MVARLKEEAEAKEQASLLAEQELRRDLARAHIDLVSDD
jgi:hypothetical protein